MFNILSFKVAIYHDSQHRNLYVSIDEGRSWNQADGIPNGAASMIIAHPFDNRYVNCLLFNIKCGGLFLYTDFVITQAFVLSESTVHYRTEDRGRTWRPFTVPAPPALVAEPLSFHSDPKKYGYILYQGTTCETVGWSAKCRDHVIDVHFDNSGNVVDLDLSDILLERSFQ